MTAVKDLTRGPIGKQLFYLSLPIISTSFIQMAYSLTDMAWVGRLGTKSVAAIGAVGILVWLTNSVSLLNKVGAEISVAQAIGAQNLNKARCYASHNISISLIVSLIWASLLFAFAYPILGIYKMEAAIEMEAVRYLRIVLCAFPFLFLSASFTGIYNAAGLSKIPFYINGSGLILNLVLDPVFIFALDMGTAGAALATLISQVVVCLLFFVQLKLRDKLLGSFPFFVRLQPACIRKIVKLGLPVTLFSGFFAIINLLMGRISSTFGGHIGLMTLTAGGQIEGLAWNTSQGFSTGLSAFVAQNYAAKKKSRILRAYRSGLIITTVFGLLLTLLFVFFGGEVFSFFVPGQTAFEAGQLFLRIEGYTMLFMMLEITIQGVFFGAGRTLPPALISSLFNLLRIPLAILLAKNGMGLAGIWWAISLTSLLKGLTAFIWFQAIKKRMLQFESPESGNIIPNR